jgi:hypothetical protein
MLLDPDRLGVNPDAIATAVRIGEEEHQAVLVIDDFFADPSYVRELALSLHYHRSGDRLPFQARISLDISPVLNSIRRVTHPELEVSRTHNAFVFSVMDERASALARHQPHPHIDNLGEGQAGLAALVYLNPPSQCRGGTAIYRHRETGLLEYRGEITPGLARYMAKHGLTSADDAVDHMTRVTDEEMAALTEAAKETDWGSLTDSNETWELAKLLEMRFNRCVVFDGYFFHGPYMRSGDFGRTLETRRITQTLYFELPESA